MWPVTVEVDFLKVVPADIARVGPTGACLLALVRFVTAVDDDRNGREVIDGEVWWRVSHAGMAEALGGVSHDAVRRAVSKLENRSELAVFDPKDSSDRTRYYRAVDVSLRETASPLSSHYAEPREPNAKSRNPNAKSRHPLREIASCTIPIKNYQESEEVEENTTREALALLPGPNPPKPRRGKAKSKPTKTPIPDGWTPTAEQLAALADKYPDLDIRWELEAFQDWALSTGAQYVDWLAAFRKRLHSGGDFNKPRNRARPSTADQRVRDIQALKSVPLELDA